MSDKGAPIVPMDYIAGVKVVDIGEARIARGMSRRPFSGCHHNNCTYDNQERRVWCLDCESTIEPFDAFVMIVGYFDAAQKKIDKAVTEVNEARAFSLISIAAKKIDKLWRRRNMVPCCPHCKHGILPEDVDRMCSVGKDYEKARRDSQSKNP